jgi:Double zinc ribbon
MELTKNNDWYAYLGLSRDATPDEIRSGIERLSRQASALATTSPERSQLLRETIRAIKRDLLPAPGNRAPGPVPPAPGPVPPAPAPMRPSPVPAPAGYPAGTGTTAGSRLARFLRTGWTCPACGKGGVPSDKFCTRCGTPIRAVRPDDGPTSDRAPRPICSACANPLSPMDAFCSRCGTRRDANLPIVTIQPRTCNCRVIIALLGIKHSKVD